MCYNIYDYYLSSELIHHFDKISISAINIINYEYEYV